LRKIPLTNENKRKKRRQARSKNNIDSACLAVYPKAAIRLSLVGGSFLDSQKFLNNPISLVRYLRLRPRPVDDRVRGLAIWDDELAGGWECHASVVFHVIIRLALEPSREGNFLGHLEPKTQVEKITNVLV